MAVSRRDPIAVIGGGLAGAAIAAQLCRVGWQAHLYADPHHAGASGVPAAVLAPRIAAAQDPLLIVRHAGLRMMRAWLRHLEALGFDSGRIASGAILVPVRERARARYVREATARTVWRMLTPDEAVASAGFNPGVPAVFHPHGVCLQPSRLIHALLAFASNHIQHHACRIDHIEACSGRVARWQLLGSQGALGPPYRHVVVATGAAMSQLLPEEHARLFLPARGQITGLIAGTQSTGMRLPLSADGFMTPAIDGLHWVGATTNRNDTSEEPRPDDDERNAAWARQWWPQETALAPARRYVGIRATTRDRLPIVGELMPGLWMSGGHGSHGLSTMFPAARIIARQLEGRRDPLAKWLSPARAALQRGSGLDGQTLRSR